MASTTFCTRRPSSPVDLGLAAFPDGADEVGDGRVLGPGHRLEVPVHAVHPGLGFGREDSQRRRRSLGSPQRDFGARAVAGDPYPVVLALDEIQRPAALQRKGGAVVAADHRHRKVVDVHLLVVPGAPGVVAAVGLVADFQVGGAGNGYRTRPAHEPQGGVNYVHADVDERAAAVERLGVERALGARRKASTTVPSRSDEIHLAQFAALDALLEGDSLGNEPGLKVHGQDPVSRSGPRRPSRARRRHSAPAASRRTRACRPPAPPRWRDGGWGWRRRR